MKVLIIEDTDYKVEGLSNVVAEALPNAKVTCARAFHTGIEKLREFKPNIVLLDMTLPTFETETGELDGRTRLYGGREVLAEMEFAGVKPKVIIVTQFDRFGEPPNVIEFPALLKQLSKSFPDLISGGVYFSNVTTRWRRDLHSLLTEAAKKFS
jgi:DNA-binding NarL/FixJ family response regulator